MTTHGATASSVEREPDADAGDRLASSRLQQLHRAGQAVWLDFIDRRFLENGGLRELVDREALTGVTSNPAIFEKAMGHSDAYEPGIAALLGRATVEALEIYEHEAIADIRAAASGLRAVYDRLDGRDGYVSLEVSPHLAHDTDATIQEARRLHAAVGVPNLMVKVPGTEAGVPAIRQLIQDGININVTLLFSLEAYQSVAIAYLEGLEARVAEGKPIDHVASVASFFVSRIDTLINQKIDMRTGHGDAQAAALLALRGKVAIANAKLAYAWYEELIASDRWQRLATQGAMPQRLLWASTGVKDPACAPTLYVDALIGADTVNTMPPATMDAFRASGTVASTLTRDLHDARNVLDEAQRLNLDLAGVTTFLVEDGVKQFVDAFDALLASVGEKRADILGRVSG